MTVQHSECSCSTGVCNCTHSTSSPEEKGTEEQQAFEVMVLEQVQALSAWWQEQPEHLQKLACTCARGADACSCEDEASVQNSTEPGAAAEDGAGETASMVGADLHNETEASLSLWWAGGGGHGGGWRRAWGRRGRAGGFVGGCGCGFRGCLCGGVRYGGGGGWR